MAKDQLYWVCKYCDASAYWNNLGKEVLHIKYALLAKEASGEVLNSKEWVATNKKPLGNAFLWGHNYYENCVKFYNQEGETDSLFVARRCQELSDKDRARHFGELADKLEAREKGEK